MPKYKCMLKKLAYNTKTDGQILVWKCSKQTNQQNIKIDAQKSLICNLSLLRARIMLFIDADTEPSLGFQIQARWYVIIDKIFLPTPNSNPLSLDYGGSSIPLMTDYFVNKDAYFHRSNCEICHPIRTNVLESSQKALNFLSEIQMVTKTVGIANTARNPVWFERW